MTRELKNLAVRWMINLYSEHQNYCVQEWAITPESYRHTAEQVNQQGSHCQYLIGV